MDKTSADDPGNKKRNRSIRLTSLKLHVYYAYMEKNEGDAEWAKKDK